MRALAFLLSLRPALPMSLERPCTQASNREIKQWMRDGAVLMDGTPLREDEFVTGEVESLVFFPNSKKRRATLW